MNISQPGGHLDQMLRQTRAHHVQLSSMADLKSSMLLTMSSIVLTIAAPRTMDPEYRAAGLVLITFCLVTIALAAYSAMPKLPLRITHPGPGELHSARFNLLFFGDFSRLSYEEFTNEMEKVLNDPTMTYEMQVRELYSLGVFLATQKYRYLRLAYLSFIAGLAAAAGVVIVSGAGR